MKAIVKKDLMNLGNEGKVVDIVTEIPAYSGITFQEEGRNAKATHTMRRVWLVKGINRMQRTTTEGKMTVPVTITYGVYKGDDLLSEEELEFMENVK